MEKGIGGEKRKKKKSSPIYGKTNQIDVVKCLRICLRLKDVKRRNLKSFLIKRMFYFLLKVVYATFVYVYVDDFNFASIFYINLI